MSREGPPRSGRHGGKLKSGGNHPRPGRPSVSGFRKAILELIDEPEAARQLLSDAFGKGKRIHPSIVNEARKLALAYGYGKPAQPITGGDPDDEPVKVKVEWPE